KIRILIVELVGVVIGLGAAGVAVILRPPVTCDEAPRQGTPGDDGNALGTAEGNHLAFFFAIYDVVVVLHRGEPAQPETVGGVDLLGRLRGIDKRRSEIERFVGLHRILERSLTFLNWRLRRVSVDLVSVDFSGA